MSTAEAFILGFACCLGLLQHPFLSVLTGRVDRKRCAWRVSTQTALKPAAAMFTDGRLRTPHRRRHSRIWGWQARSQLAAVSGRAC
jgi:hypothetical protein